MIESSKLDLAARSTKADVHPVRKTICVCVCVCVCVLIFLFLTHLFSSLSIQQYEREKKVAQQGLDDEGRPEPEGTDEDVDKDDQSEGYIEGGTFTSLTLEHVQGVFFILALGYAASLLVYIGEVLCLTNVTNNI